MDEAKRGVEDTFRVKPEDIREQYECQLKVLRKLTAKRCWSWVRKKIAVPIGRRAEMMETRVPRRSARESKPTDTPS